MKSLEIGSLSGAMSRVMASPQHAHEVTTWARSRSMMDTPSASQAQLAYDPCRDVCTAKGVGTAENGGAIRISPLPGWSTTMRPDARRVRLALISAADLCAAEASSVIVGGAPRARVTS